MKKILLLLTLIFPLINKYSYIITNQYTQIPIIKAVSNPDYLANDWYVNVSRNFGPRTFFAYYMAMTAQIFTIPGTFFIHYLLYIFFVYIATYKLSFLFFKKKWTSLLTAITLSFGSSITLGGNILVTKDFSAPQLALGISLLAIVCLFEKNYLFSAVSFILASFFHPLIGFESAILFYFSTVTAYIILKKPIRVLLKKGILPYLIISIPIFFIYFQEGSKSTVPSLIKSAIYAKMRNPHHLIPSSFPLNHYILFIFLLSLFLIIMKFSGNLVKKLIKMQVIFSLFLIISATFVGYLTTELYPVYPFIILQPFRLTIYFYWITATFIFAYLFYLSTQKASFNKVFIIPLLLTNPHFLFSLDKSKIAGLLIILLTTVFYKFLNRKIIIILLLIFFSLQNYHQKFNFNKNFFYYTDEIELAQFADLILPDDSVFFVPPEFESFRSNSDRAIVADWKAFPFQEKAMLEWAQRMCDIGNIINCNYETVTQNNVIKGFRSLNSNDIKRLSVKYGYDYFISDVNYPEFEKLKANRFYLYKI